jgi:putative transposase
MGTLQPLIFTHRRTVVGADANNSIIHSLNIRSKNGQFPKRKAAARSSRCWRPRQQPEWEHVALNFVYFERLFYFCIMLTYHTEFLTSTILNWQHLLASDVCKNIICNTLSTLVQERKCTVWAFVLMPNHMHLLWKIANGWERKKVQGALLSFTAHEFKKYLTDYQPHQLRHYCVNDADRTFQFWERNPLAKECFTEPFFLQKLAYIHNNPCQPKWQLCEAAEDYQWSSAAFYSNGSNRFPWLTHYRD